MKDQLAQINLSDLPESDLLNLIAGLQGLISANTRLRTDVIRAKAPLIRQLNGLDQEERNLSNVITTAERDIQRMQRHLVERQQKEQRGARNAEIAEDLVFEAQALGAIEDPIARGVSRVLTVATTESGLKNALVDLQEEKPSSYQPGRLTIQGVDDKCTVGIGNSAYVIDYHLKPVTPDSVREAAQGIISTAAGTNTDPKVTINPVYIGIGIQFVAPGQVSIEPLVRKETKGIASYYKPVEGSGSAPIREYLGELLQAGQVQLPKRLKGK